MTKILLTYREKLKKVGEELRDKFHQLEDEYR